MLEITDLTYRIGGRPLLENASAFIAEGWKVGLVGKNGSGKTTLLRLIREEAGEQGASVRTRRGARLGFVAQEIPPVADALLDVVLAADTELFALNSEAETATDPQRIADIHLRLAELDGYSAEARASAILVGLGFEQSDLRRPAREFSGGWRMRAALAGVLFSTPDLLILDEPTNYLDLEGAAWLEEYLRDYPHTVLVVSHDREMLNRSVTHVLALDDRKLEIVVGGYDSYLKKRAERFAQASSMKAKQDAHREDGQGGNETAHERFVRELGEVVQIAGDQDVAHAAVAHDDGNAQGGHLADPRRSGVVAEDSLDHEFGAPLAGDQPLAYVLRVGRSLNLGGRE